MQPLRQVPEKLFEAPKFIFKSPKMIGLKSLSDGHLLKDKRLKLKFLRGASFHHQSLPPKTT